MSAATNALEEALAVNRLLVRQTTYDAGVGQYERHAILVQLERERGQLAAGLRTLRSTSPQEMRRMTTNAAGLVVANRGLLPAVDNAETHLESMA